MILLFRLLEMNKMIIKLSKTTVDSLVVVSPNLGKTTFLKIMINCIILICHNKAAGDSIYNSGAKPPQESVDVSQVPAVPGLKKLAAVNAMSLKHVI